MRLVRDFARLFCEHKPEIAFLNKKIANLQELIPVEEAKPDIEIVEIGKGGVLADLDPLGLKMMYPTLIDSQYYFTNSWAEVLSWLYLEFEMPKYLSDRFDCDDFSFLLKGLISSFFGLNYFAVVFGKTPTAYHSWNMFRDEQGLLNLEPQMGKFFPLGEQGYTPEYVLL